MDRVRSSRSRRTSHASEIPFLKLPNGRSLTGHSHDYKRHGTSTLFAAFEVATGKVKAAHKKRRRRKEFLDFMDEVVAAYPRSRLEVIVDNLNIHKKNEEWLARHPKPFPLSNAAQVRCAAGKQMDPPTYPRRAVADIAGSCPLRAVGRA